MSIHQDVDFNTVDLSDPNGITNEHLTYGLVPKSGLTHLEAAAYRGTLLRVKTLVAHGASVHTGHPLHHACQNPNPEEAYAIVSYLIQSGCDVNQMDADDERRNTGRPLHWAAEVEGEHANRIIELLLEHGADPDGRSVQGFSPLGRAQYLGVDTAERTRLLKGLGSVAPWGVKHAVAYKYMNGCIPVSPGTNREDMKAFKKAADVDQETDGKGVSFGLILE